MSEPTDRAQKTIDAIEEHMDRPRPASATIARAVVGAMFRLKEPEPEPEHAWDYDTGWTFIQAGNCYQTGRRMVTFDPRTISQERAEEMARREVAQYQGGGWRVHGATTIEMFGVIDSSG